MGWLDTFVSGGGPAALTSGIFGALGGGAMSGALKQGRSDLQNLPGMAGPQGIGGNFGQVSASGQFTLDPTLMGAQQALGGTIGGMLGGGMYADPRFQNALSQADLAGAMGQANQAFGQTAGTTAFGQLGGLASLLGGQVAGGPQDLSGGMMGNLMQQGMQNQMQAGNQQGMYAQSLAQQRAMAQPEFARQQQGLEQSLFSKGMLGAGSTATGEGFRGLFEAQNMADLGFQQNAFNQALQQQQFMGQLGGQQMGQGMGLMGQNLGQFNQNIGNLQGLEQLGFGQQLAGMGFNTQQGMQRLGAAQGLFGLGSQMFGQGYGLGLSGIEGLQGMGQLGLQAARSPFELQANLLQGSGEHAAALGAMAANQAQASGGLFGGLGESVGKIAGIAGIFSDIRLKSNIQFADHIDDLNWYTWDWNDVAKSLGVVGPTYGVLAQEIMFRHPDAVALDASGYYKVDYSKLGVE